MLPILIVFLLFGSFFALAADSAVSAVLHVSPLAYKSGSMVYGIDGNFTNPTSAPVSIFISSGISDSQGGSDNELIEGYKPLANGNSAAHEKFLTILEPYSQVSISFDVSNDDFSLSNNYVSVWAYSGNERVKVSEFDLTSVSNPADSMISLKIKDAYAILLPVFLLVFLASAVILASFIKNHGKETSNNGEFTIRSLLMPVFEAKSSILDKFAVIFTNPVLWIDEALFVLLLLAIIYSPLSAQFGSEDAFRIIIFAGIGAGILPFVYLFGAYLLDFKVAHKPFRFFMAFFMWGAVSAVLAFFTNGMISNAMGFFSLDMSSAYAIILATALVSPLVEEVIKGIGIYIGSKHKSFDSVPTGMLLGFACGVGFSFVENWFYFTSRTTPFELGFEGWIALIAYRSFFNALSHGIFSGAVGGFLGYIKGNPKFAQKYHLGIVPAIAFAVLLHSVFNSSAIVDTIAISQYDFAFFIFNPAIAVAFNLLFVIALFLSIKEFWSKNNGQPPKAAGTGKAQPSKTAGTSKAQPPKTAGTSKAQPPKTAGTVKAQSPKAAGTVKAQSLKASSKNKASLRNAKGKN